MSAVPLDDTMHKRLMGSLDNLIIGMKKNSNVQFRPLSTRYIIAIVEEYNRCLMEH